MGLESYNFLLFAKGNTALISKDELGNSMLDIIGDLTVNKSFSEIINHILSIDNVHPYTPTDLYSFQSTGCYFCLNDGFCIIEIEVNNGEIAEEIEEISIRFAVCNPIGTYEKAITLCKTIARALSLEVYDIRLKETLDFSNEMQMVRSKKCFEEKQKYFYVTYNLPNGLISVPLHCGKAFWDWIRNKQ